MSFECFPAYLPPFDSETGKSGRAYLVPLQVADPLEDRGLHAAALVPQLAVFLAEELLPFQQSGVAARQFLLVDPQHGQLAERLAQLPPDFLGVSVKCVQQLLNGRNTREINVTVLTTSSLACTVACFLTHFFFCSDSCKHGDSVAAHVEIYAIQAVQ